MGELNQEFLACGACPVDLEYTINGPKKASYKVVIEHIKN